jgi:hypothetical protein
MSNIDDSEEQSVPAGAGTVKQVIRKGDGDINLCITIVNNVGAGGAGLSTVTSSSDPAAAPNPPSPMVGPDPDMPMPWSASAALGAPSDGMAAPLLVKGFTPWGVGSNTHAGIGDRFAIWSNTPTPWPRGGIFITKLHNPPGLPAGTWGQGRGFAFGPTPTTASAAIVTNDALATAGYNFAGHRIDATTAPAFRITNVTQTGWGASANWSVTVERTDVTKDAYLLAFPQKIGPAFTSASEADYLKLAVVPTNVAGFAAGTTSGTFAITVSRNQPAVNYYFFLCDASPKADDQIPRVVSNVRKVLAT